MIDPKRIALSSPDKKEMNTILWYSTTVALKRRLTIKSLIRVEMDIPLEGICTLHYDYYLDSIAKDIESTSLSLRKDTAILRSKIDYIESIYPPIPVKTPHALLIDSMKFSKLLSGKKITDIINF